MRTQERLLSNPDAVLEVLKSVSELLHLMLISEKGYQKLKVNLQNIDLDAVFEHIDQKKRKKLDFNYILEWMHRESFHVSDFKLEKMYERWQRIGTNTSNKDPSGLNFMSTLDRKIFRQQFKDISIDILDGTNQTMSKDIEGYEDSKGNNKAEDSKNRPQFYTISHTISQAVREMLLGVKELKSIMNPLTLNQRY